MNRKDIALTVVGVLATAGLTYLLYRRQQQGTQAQASSSAAATMTDPTDPNYYPDQNGLYAESLAYQMGSQSTINVPSISGATSASDSSSSVDTSATTAATGSQSGTDYNNLLAQIVAAYASGSSSTTPAVNEYQETDFSGLSIPTQTVQPGLTVSGIPTTAAAAAENANQMLGINGDLLSNAGAVQPPSIAPAPTTVGAGVYTIPTQQSSIGSGVTRSPQKFTQTVQ